MHAHGESGPRLLVRGGSIAAGYGVARSYVDIIQERYARCGVEIINRSHHRQTSFDGIDSFDQEIDPYRPEMLMIHFGIDDAFFPVYRSEFKENLVQIVRLARQRFDPMILLPTAQTFDNPFDMDAVNIYYRTIREVAVDRKRPINRIYSNREQFVMEYTERGKPWESRGEIGLKRRGGSGPNI